LYVFGSRADEILAMLNNQTEDAGKNGSDIDLGIFPEEFQEWSPSKKVNFTIELEDLFQILIKMPLKLLLFHKVLGPSTSGLLHILCRFHNKVIPAKAGIQKNRK